MKLTKRQKDIVKQIKEGKIYDVESYIRHYDLGEFIKYDYEEFSRAFEEDDINKKFYYPKDLTPNVTNVLTIETYNYKVESGKIDEKSYTVFSLELVADAGNVTVNIHDVEYHVNLYEGIYVAKSFGHILDFLTVWEYLKSEMLILELSTELKKTAIELFFEKSLMQQGELKENELDRNINYKAHSLSDNYYIESGKYIFSREKFIICEEYLKKRIYPTPSLNLYIQNKFSTKEEAMQKSALVAAWLAIFVSIILTFVPHIYSLSTSDGNSEQIEENTER